MIRPTIYCYACDAPATGTRNRTQEAERAKVPACTRHRDENRRVLRTGTVSGQRVRLLVPEFTTL